MTLRFYRGNDELENKNTEKKSGLSIQREKFIYSEMIIIVREEDF